MGNQFGGRVDRHESVLMSPPRRPGRGPAGRMVRRAELARGRLLQVTQDRPGTVVPGYPRQLAARMRASASEVEALDRRPVRHPPREELLSGDVEMPDVAV